MFADPFAALMAMFFLCFIGMLIMFLFVIRSLSVLSNVVKDETHKYAVAFADIEKQLMDITFIIRNTGKGQYPSSPLVAKTDSPDIMTDSDLSSLLTSISDRAKTGYNPELPYNIESSGSKENLLTLMEEKNTSGIQETWSSQKKGLNDVSYLSMNTKKRD